MKQGNGMDLLGPNEPRGTEVGIIYVSPTDDRQSVLAAIITQEKLGRKQVAIVLPKQNKAFDQPQDFDDLKGFRRKLRTQLVFIVPGGPGPADLARQRRFDVYSSLENYASALRQEFQESAQPRRSWLFGSPRFKSTPARNAENGHEAPDQLATPTSSRRTATATPAGNGTPPPTSGRSSTAVATPNTRNAALAGALDAGMLAANLEHGSDKSPTNENSGPSENHPGQSPTTPPGNVRPPLADGQDDAAQKSAQPSDARELPDDYDFYETSLDDSRALPIHDEDDYALSPGDPAGSENREPSLAGDQNAAGQDAPPSTSRASNTPEPHIIELPVHSRNTAKLPPRPAVETDQAEPAPQRRDSAKVLAANAPGGGPTPRTTGGGGQPPMRGSFGDSGRGGGGGSRRSGPRWWVAALLIFLAVLLVSSILITLAYAYPNQMGPIAGMLPKGSPTTKITITPDNKVISNSYVILAVPGKADPNQRQVTSRSLTSPAQKNTRTVKATGHNKTNGTVATGMFTFLNGTSTPKTIPAGQQIPASNGVTFTTTAQANMPASNLTSGFIGKATVPARANTVGTDGNIRAGAVNKSCCSANNDISVINNAAFSGGQDPKDYNFVKQGDYDSAVNALTGQLTQQANAALTSQIKTTEQLAAQSRCPATVTRNNQVGDHGVNVNSVDVTVSVTCNAVAYDQAGMQSIVMKLLQDKAAQDLGEGYALKGNLVTQSRVQSVNPDKSVSLIVDSKGLWVYQFPNDFKTQVAKSVAGMTVNQANTTIKGMKGVQNVTISTNGGNLPGDTAQIEVVIQDLAPLPGVTPTPGPSGPVTTPPGQNTPQPGNG